MTLRSAARAAGAALMFAPAGLLAQQKATYTAQSLVSAAGNVNTDPRYQTPVSPAYNGVGSVHINTTAGTFICTGSLLSDGQTVLTAGHCVSHFPGTILSMSVDFYPNGSTPVNIAATNWFAKAEYSGHVIDENDIGVIHLNRVADANITRYSLYTGTAENQGFQFVGFGNRGSNGAGATSGAGFALSSRRTGYNLFDITLGDSRFNCPANSPYCAEGENFWYDPDAATGHVLFTDFDNGSTGLLSNDGMCFLGNFDQQMQIGTTECNAGRGLDEALSAGGDSGGPGFINGQIASVTSFGLTFGTYNNGPGTGPWGDIDASLNSSFGEYAGFTDVAYQAQWVTANLVPEPSSMVLTASGLIGMAGFAARRRNKKA
jgi:hypothetical protein